MTEYSLELKSGAQKSLDALSDEIFRRIDRKLLALPSNPKPPGCTKLTGYTDLWRMRIGDWRVLYTIDEPRKHICIVRVAHRREAYQL